MLFFFMRTVLSKSLSVDHLTVFNCNSGYVKIFRVVIIGQESLYDKVRKIIDI